MSASNRQVLRGRKDTTGITRPARPTPGGRLASHALAIAVVGLAVAAVLTLYAQREDVPSRPEITAASVTAPANTGAAAAANPIGAIDHALASGDIRAARGAWHQAYRAAVRRPQWEEMAALGDAALERGVSGQRVGEVEARQAYLGALFRAKAQGSLKGVLRATEAFATLGDRDVVDEGLRIADATARRSSEPDAAGRVAALRARIDAQARVPDPRGPSLPVHWDAGP